MHSKINKGPDMNKLKNIKGRGQSQTAKNKEYAIRYANAVKEKEKELGRKLRMGEKTNLMKSLK